MQSVVSRLHNARPQAHNRRGAARSRREQLTQAELRGMGPVKELPPLAMPPSSSSSGSDSDTPGPAPHPREGEGRSSLGASPRWHLGAVLDDHAAVQASKSASHHFKHLERRARMLASLQMRRGEQRRGVMDRKTAEGQAAANLDAIGDLFAAVDITNMITASQVNAAAAALNALRRVEDMIGPTFVAHIFVGESLMRHIVTSAPSTSSSRVVERIRGSVHGAPAMEGAEDASSPEALVGRLLAAFSSAAPRAAVAGPPNNNNAPAMRRLPTLEAALYHGCDPCEVAFPPSSRGPPSYVGQMILPSRATVHQATTLIVLRWLLMRCAVGLVGPGGALVRPDSPFAVAPHPLTALLACTKLFGASPHNGVPRFSLTRLVPASSSWASSADGCADDAAFADTHFPSEGPADEGTAGGVITACGAMLLRTTFFCDKLAPEKKGDGEGAPADTADAALHGPQRSKRRHRLVIRNAAATAQSAQASAPCGVAISSRPLLKIVLKKALNEFQVQAADTQPSEPDIVAAIGPPFALCIDVPRVWEMLMRIQDAEAAHRAHIEHRRFEAADFFYRNYRAHLLTRDITMRHQLHEIEERAFEGILADARQAYAAAERAALMREECESRSAHIEDPYAAFAHTIAPLFIERLHFSVRAEALIRARVFAVEEAAFFGQRFLVPCPQSPHCREEMQRWLVLTTHMQQFESTDWLKMADEAYALKRTAFHTAAVSSRKSM